MARLLSDQQQINYNRLYTAGFSAKEAQDLVSTERQVGGRTIEVSLLNLNDSLVRTMIRTRARAAQRAKRAGLSRQEFIMNTRRRLLAQGIDSIWDLLRAYEKRFPNLGDSPPAKGSHHKTAITDKDIQRGRDRARKITDTKVVSTHKYPDGRIAGYNEAGRFVRWM